MVLQRKTMWTRIFLLVLIDFEFFGGATQSSRAYKYVRNVSVEFFLIFLFVEFGPQSC
jgi:hypothetical protein